MVFDITVAYRGYGFTQPQLKKKKFCSIVDSSSISQLSNSISDVSRSLRGHLTSIISITRSVRPKDRQRPISSYYHELRLLNDLIKSVANRYNKK